MRMSEAELVSLLRESGLKVTPQRLAICNFVLSSKEHPTVEQIHSEMLKTHPSISLNTVYQTMDMLIGLSLVQEMRFTSSSSRFDPNTSVHVNVICEKCGSITDFESKTLEKRWMEIVEEIGEQAVGQRLDLYTICKNCK
jgi:Fur family peroxide stress response transcriptional regulator